MSMLSPVNQSLAATCWAEGRIDIIGISNTGHMLHISWPSQLQDGWDVLGGSFQTIAPTIISQSDNQLDVFGLEQDTDLMLHSSWNGTYWSSWETVGTQQYKSPLVSTSWSPGRLDVFGLGLADGQVYRQWVCERLGTRLFACINLTAVGRWSMAERLANKPNCIRE
jgi:hypothetical protein